MSNWDELHRRGRPEIDDRSRERRAWSGTQACCDTKLHDAMLALAVARLWLGTPSNALEPGWVATKMGGPVRLDASTPHIARRPVAR